MVSVKDGVNLGGEVYRILHGESRLREDATASMPIASSMRNCSPLDDPLAVLVAIYRIGFDQHAS